MHNEISEDETMIHLKNLMLSMNLSANQLRKLADRMELLDEEEDKAENQKEVEEHEPEILTSNKVSDLELPKFVFLRK